MRRCGVFTQSDGYGRYPVYLSLLLYPEMKMSFSFIRYSIFFPANSLSGTMVSNLASDAFLLFLMTLSFNENFSV
jgi:hypothetical protein